MDWSAARPELRRHTRPRKQERVLRFGKGVPLPCRQDTRTSRLDGFGLSLAARVAKQTGADTLVPRWQRRWPSTCEGRGWYGGDTAPVQVRHARARGLTRAPSPWCRGGTFAIISTSWWENILLEAHARVVEWQTRGSQKPLGATSCEFDSRLGHHPDKRAARPSAGTGCARPPSSSWCPRRGRTGYASWAESRRAGARACA